MGLESRQPAQCGNPPLGVGSARKWVLPRCPAFMSADVAYVTLRWPLCRFLRHRIRNKGAGGGGLHGTQEGHGHGKPLSPIPEPIVAGDLTQAKVFTGPQGALMRGSHLDVCFLHWEEKGWVKWQRSSRKLEFIPQMGSILRGLYDPG